MAHRGKIVTVSTSPQILSVLLGLPSTNSEACAQLTLRADRGNLGDVTVGWDPTLNPAEFVYKLSPGDSFTYGPFSAGVLRTDELWMFGTSGDKVETPYIKS